MSEVQRGRHFLRPGSEGNRGTCTNGPPTSSRPPSDPGFDSHPDKMEWRPLSPRSRPQLLSNPVSQPHFPQAFPSANAFVNADARKKGTRNTTVKKKGKKKKKRIENTRQERNFSRKAYERVRM